ncbi:OmpA family protein [Pendulispora albinea]|uniref:OmpA family protein n=1 Tax=Pendulispora albinea TaxID=2741071 RepID=A0ABZ2M4C0_9BACT
MTAWKTVAALVCAGAGLFGCAEQPKAVKIPPTGTSETAFKSHWEKGAKKERGVAGKDDAAGAMSAAQAKRDGASGDEGSVLTSGLRVPSEIVRACDLPQQQASATFAPKFDFDGATIGPDDRDVLATLARCLSDGALRGRRVTLVGRADARGEAEYNMSLGESRADAVLRYLHDLGVARDRVKTSSRGELDAAGNDEASYALDRRVDIELAN